MTDHLHEFMVYLGPGELVPVLWCQWCGEKRPLPDESMAMAESTAVARETERRARRERIATAVFAATVGALTLAANSRGGRGRLPAGGEIALSALNMADALIAALDAK